MRFKLLAPRDPPLQVKALLSWTDIRGLETVVMRLNPHVANRSVFPRPSRPGLCFGLDTVVAWQLSILEFTPALPGRFNI